MKRENCGSCLKHPLEEELQADRADGCEGTELSALKQTWFLQIKIKKKKSQIFFLLVQLWKLKWGCLFLFPRNGVSLSVSRKLALLLKCWTLRTRCVLRSRVEIFQPGGQRSAVCGYQMQLSWFFIYLLIRKCGRVPFSGPPCLCFFCRSVVSRADLLP